MSRLECRYLTFNRDGQFTTLQMLAQVMRCSLSTEDPRFGGPDSAAHLWMYRILTYMLSRQLGV